MEIKSMIEWVETSCGSGDELTSDKSQHTDKKNQCFTMTDKVLSVLNKGVYEEANLTLKKKPKD